MPHRGGNSLVVAHRPLAGIQIEKLPQCHVQGTKAAAYWGGQWALDRYAEVANSLHSVVRQPLLKHIESLFAGKDFKPGNAPLPAVGVLYCGVEHAPRSFPDVAPGAVAFDKGNDRHVRNLQFAAGITDRFAAGRNGMPVVGTLHRAYLLQWFSLIYSRCPLTLSRIERRPARIKEDTTKQ